MKRNTAFHFRHHWRRFLAVVVAVTMFSTLAPIGVVSAEESGAGGTAGSG